MGTVSGTLILQEGNDRLTNGVTESCQIIEILLLER